MAVHDLRRALGQYNQQVSRRIELMRMVDFRQFPASPGDTQVVLDIPASFVFDRCVVILCVPEPSIATMDLMVFGYDIPLLWCGSLNGAANEKIAFQACFPLRDKLFTQATALSVRAADDLVAGKIKIIVYGCMVDLP